MLDLSASARRLYRRLLGRRDDAGKVDPGTPTEADGASAVAALEGWISDPIAAGDAAARGRLAAAAGLAAAGRRAAAFLAGPELAASLDLLAQAAARRLPLVVHVTARAGFAAGDSAGGGHQTYHAAAATGAVLLFATDVQNAVDLTLVGRRLAEDALCPVVVAMDDAETARSVQDLRLPPRAALRRFLGRPGELVHPPTASQETVFGKHRRRVPRWHDPERPLLHGSGLGAEAYALAGAARHAYFDVHLPELLERASEAFSEEIGRRPEALVTHHVKGARFLLIAQGAAVETAQAAAVALRAAGVPVGVVGLSVLRPLPAAGLAEILRGRQGVMVLERVDQPLAAEAPLTGELRSLLRNGKDVPRLASAFYGLGGYPLRGADLFALVRELAGRDAAWRSGVYLGLDPAAAGAVYPKRQALADALQRAYPDSARLGARGQDAPELVPADALTLTVHRLAETDGFSREAAALLRRLLGGSLRSRPAAGGASWGSELVDVVIHAPSLPGDPGDGIAADVAVWRAGGGARGLRERLKKGGVVLLADGSRPAGLRRAVEERGLKVYAAAGDGDERLLGALMGVLGMEGRAEVSLRKLLKARREMLEEHRAGDVEAHLDELQAGFERVTLLDAGTLAEDAEPAASEGPPPAGPPPAVRRMGKSAAPLADLPGFWDRVGVLYRDGRSDGLAPDPFLATATVPPLSAALHDLSPARAMLPAFDPAPCTGCGACWTACPDSAVGPVAIAPSALLEYGMKQASARGGSVDKLRMVSSKIASRIQQEMASESWDGGPAGPLFDAAFSATLEKMKLPDERKAGIGEAYAAVRDEIAELPVASTDAFHEEIFSLALDPDACKGCGLCVAACEPEALTAADDTPERTAAARALWRFCDELPEPADATVERARRHPDVGLMAGALLARAAREVMAGGHGAEPGSGAAAALRQVLGAAAFHRRGELASQLAEVGELRAKLADAVHSGLSQALPTRDLDALAEGLDALKRPDADLAELTARVETAFENERVDVTRTRRLVDAARAVADLEWRFTTGEGGLGRAPLGVVIDGSEIAWAGAFPRNPFRVPVTVDATGAAADLARGLAEGQLRETVDAVRVLRRARLELDRPAEAARAAQEVDELTWRDLTDEERRHCPPLFLVTAEAALRRSSLAGLLELAASELPVKVVLLSDPSEVAPSSSLVATLRAGMPPAALRVESSVAEADHLERAVADAVAGGGPAVLRILAPSPGRHGLASDAMLARARELVESGAFALSRFDAEAEPAPPAEEGAPSPVAAAGSEVAALEQRHAAELAAVRRDYEARLAAQRAGFQAEMAQRIRGRLMQLALKPRSPSDGEDARDSRETTP